MIKPLTPSQLGERVLLSNSYTLDPQEISQDECHMFVYSDSVEFLIASQLEQFTFSPRDPNINKKFRFAVIPNLGNLCWASFPIQFKEACKKTGELFHLEMCTASVKLENASLNTTVSFPKSDNILWFRGVKDTKGIDINRGYQTIKELAILTEKLGID